MDFEKNFREHRAFFKRAARLRYVDRRPGLHAKELRHNLSEIAVLAKTAESPAVAERASCILADFAERHEHAQDLLDDVNEHRWAELKKHCPALVKTLFAT